MTLSSHQALNCCIIGDIWLADTGTSCHIPNSDSGAVLTKDDIAKMRKLRPATVLNSKTKQKMNINMVNCRFSGSKLYLCLLIKMTNSGWKMAGDTTGIYLWKGKITIHFHIPIQTPEGRIWAIQMERTAPSGQEVSLASPLAKAV